MKRFVVLLAILFGIVGLAHPAPVISTSWYVCPSEASGFSRTLCTTTAINAINQGLTSFGTPGTPSYYQALTSTTVGAVTACTGFSCWNGVVNPIGAFAGLKGGSLNGAVVFDGNGSKIRLNQVGYSMSGDPDGIFDMGAAAGSITNYSGRAIGKIFNPDGSKTFVTSGSSNLEVDSIIFSDITESFYTDDGAGLDVTGQQALIDDVTHGINSGFSWNETLVATLSDPIIVNGPTLEGSNGRTVLATGSSALTFIGVNGDPQTDVPEPATIALVLGALTLVWVTRRRSLTPLRPTSI